MALGSPGGSPSRIEKSHLESQRTTPRNLAHEPIETRLGGRGICSFHVRPRRRMRRPGPTTRRPGRWPRPSAPILTPGRTRMASARRSVIPGVHPSKSSAGGPAREPGWFQGTHHAALVSSITTVSGIATTWPVAAESSSWSTPRKASRRPAFDHQKLAAALSRAAGGEVYRADRASVREHRV